MSWNGTAPETVTTRVDPATDYRHRLELGEDVLAALLGSAAAAPVAREERARCLLVAERLLTKAHALVGRLASPSAERRPPQTDGAIIADMIARGRLTEHHLTDAGRRDLAEHRAAAAGHFREAEREAGAAARIMDGTPP